jgi:hypothetical protein
MTAMTTHPPRERSFVTFADSPPASNDPCRRQIARSRNFSVEWIEFGSGDPCAFASDAEALVLVVEGSARIASSTSTSPAPIATIPADSVAIVPPGTHALRGDAGAVCVVIASQRSDPHGRAPLNGSAYAEDKATPASHPPFRRHRALQSPQVLGYDQIKASPEKPRLKMLQTETLSINIVDYQGPRDRAALSPHSHTDFEQGSLALKGNFVHHLRTPWGSNADLWREDEHLPAPSPSLVVIPVHVIHTTEGVGAGRHLLIDVFSPPREDFIASGWVFNSGDYRATPAIE